MIVLIVGDFGVGKDTVADIIKEDLFSQNDCVKAKKILSYTTRPKRFEEEDTHIFCSEEEFLSFDDFIALSKIDDFYYGARKCQFDENYINLYCVDAKGVKDIVESGVNNIFIIEVIRPKWLIDLPEDRLNRNRHYDDYNYKVDYRIINDGDLYKLKRDTHECIDILVREMKKSL